MFKIIGRSVIGLACRSSLRVCRRTYPTFSTSIQMASKLKKAVQEEIAHEESNTVDLSQFRNFFENQGWTLTQNGIQAELSKKNGPYELRILLTAKTPLPIDDNQGQEPQQETDMENQQDYNDMLAYIKKYGTDKWLMCQIFIASHGNANITTAQFIPDYQADKTARSSAKPLQIGYQGPQLSSLEQKFQESIYQFIEGVGITGEILQRAGEFSTAYEHQFYVQWLKDIRTLV